MKSISQSKADHLRSLYKSIGGIDASWIMTFQRAYNYTEHGPINFEVLGPAEFVDAMVDEGFSIPNLQSTIIYENRITREFEKAFAKTEHLIEQDEPREQVSDAFDELEEIIEAIGECHITLGSEYLEYRNRVDELKENW